MVLTGGKLRMLRGPGPASQVGGAMSFQSTTTSKPSAASTSLIVVTPAGEPGPRSVTVFASITL